MGHGIQILLPTEGVISSEQEPLVGIFIMVMSFQIFMFWLQPSITPFLEERRYGRIFLLLLLLSIYLLIFCRKQYRAGIVVDV